MINVFKLKRYAALILAGSLPLLMFFIAFMYYGLLYAILFYVAGLALGIVVGSMLLRNAFTSMLEGKGILTFTMDSTGIIRPFICALTQPYIKGNLDKQTPVSDVYDRGAVASLAPPPVKPNFIEKYFFKKPDLKSRAENDGDTIKITLDQRDFNKSRFGMFHYPVLIYNNQVKSCITKDFLSEGEKQAFAEHGVLYLNRKLEELTSVVRDFGRYVVELTKPKESFFKKSWVIWIVIILVAILVILFFKPVLNAFMGSGGSVVDAITSSASPVIPK